MNLEEALIFLKNLDELRITISGDIGSGKSTFAKHLEKELDISRISIGDLMREEAAKRGMTLIEFGKWQETDDSVDKMMDAKQTEVSKKYKKGIFEGRTAWHFVYKPTVTVFLSVEPKEGARRIFEDTNKNRDHFTSIDDVAKKNAIRKESEIKRYNDFYGINTYDKKHFNVFIDTTPLSIDDVFKQTVIEIAKYLKSA
ncbi:AAA family ATPase [Patescibacteria group bacterium]|nr:AAA family ATPase [Patescibacteria group bacterium]